MKLYQFLLWAVGLWLPALIFALTLGLHPLLIAVAVSYLSVAVAFSLYLWAGVEVDANDPKHEVAAAAVFFVPILALCWPRPVFIGVRNHLG